VGRFDAVEPDFAQLSPRRAEIIVGDTAVSVSEPARRAENCMNQEKAGRVAMLSGLRARAEIVADGSRARPTTESLERTVYELLVHQIELEMQADELTRARDELSESRDKYRDLYELAPVGYLSTDFDCVVLEANRAAEILLGQRASQLVGFPLARFLTPESATALHLHRREVRQRGEEWMTELRFLRGDGEVIDVQLQSIRSDFSGVHSRSVLVDVTHLKQVERELAERTRLLSHANRALVAEKSERDRTQQELTEREARLRNAEAALQRQRGFAERLIEAVPAMVLSLDGEGRILGFNARTESLTGYRIGEVIGGDWLERFVTDEAQAEVREQFVKALIGTNISVFVAPIVKKDGARRQIEWHFATMEDQSGRTSGLAAIGMDVTERQRVEEDRRQSNKMEAVGTLASGIAHDFNNVLTGIIGCVDMALAKVAADSPARLALDQVKTSALGGAQVIHQLMAFARKQPTARKVVDLNALIARMETMLNHLLGEDIELRTSLFAANPAVVCQPDEIEQMLLNLCVNARNAMPNGGQLDIVTRESRSDEEPLDLDLRRGNHVVVEVTDSGTGMDATTRERLFEPFFTTNEAGRGTGLGLSSVYSTVADHGGRIHVESQLGKGSTFFVSLPLSEEQPSAPPPVDLGEPLTVRPSGETVLVVEDEPIVRLVIRHYLKRHGYVVLEAANDEDVAHILREHAGPIDVVLSDMVLPGQSGGPQIVERVRATHPDARAVFISAHSNEMLVSTGKLSGGTRTLQKPFTESALIRRLRESRGGAFVPPAPRLPASLHRRRVLLVEDHEDVRTTLGELLTNFGFDVVMASNATEAASFYADPTTSVDALITDVSLPDVSGVELAKRVRAYFPHVGLLLMSGHSRREIPELPALLEDPRTVFFQKPVSAAPLAGALNRLLETPRTTDSDAETAQLD
jgi:PAS domain S-box-containing protein